MWATHNMTIDKFRIRQAAIFEQPGYILTIYFLPCLGTFFQCIFLVESENDIVFRNQ